MIVRRTVRHSAVNVLRAPARHADSPGACRVGVAVEAPAAVMASGRINLRIRTRDPAIDPPAARSYFGRYAGSGVADGKEYQAEYPDWYGLR